MALVMVSLTAYVLERTTLGYEVRAIGLNPSAAQSGGINVKRGMILALSSAGHWRDLGVQGRYWVCIGVS